MCRVFRLAHGVCCAPLWLSRVVWCGLLQSTYVVRCATLRAVCVMWDPWRMSRGAVRSRSQSCTVRCAAQHPHPPSLRLLRYRDETPSRMHFHTHTTLTCTRPVRSAQRSPCAVAVSSGRRRRRRVRRAPHDARRGTGPASGAPALRGQNGENMPIDGQTDGHTPTAKRLTNRLPHTTVHTGCSLPHRRCYRCTACRDCARAGAAAAACLRWLRRTRVGRAARTPRRTLRQRRRCTDLIDTAQPAAYRTPHGQTAQRFAACRMPHVAGLAQRRARGTDSGCAMWRRRAVRTCGARCTMRRRACAGSKDVGA